MLIKLASMINFEKAENGFRLKLKMPKYNYVIKTNDNYMGGYLNAKHPLPKENWIRGNDLSDGKNNEKTLIKIFKDIVRHEK